MVSPFMDDAAKLAAVRAGLPSLSAAIQLNTGTSGPLPAETAAAMAELERYELTTGRSDRAYHLEGRQRMDEARAAVAAVIGADLDGVALMHATSDGMNVATWSVDWQSGDRAVTTRHEHAGLLGPLYALRDRSGVELTFADIGDGGDDERTLEALDRAIMPGTRLVSVSHVLWTTGARLPIARIAELAHDRGASVAVDGAQAAGALPVDVAALGADWYAVSGQKWLLGPEGTGALWASRAMVERSKRTFGGHYGQATYDSAGQWQPLPDARRFQYSNYHRPAILGLARSVGWLAMFVGLDFVFERGATLTRRTFDALAAVPGIEMLSPRERLANLVTFRIAGWSADEAVDELERRVFAIVRSIPALGAVRASVGFFNSEEELDRFVEAVQLLAAHTPATLPRRPTLEIIHGA